MARATCTSPSCVTITSAALLGCAAAFGCGSNPDLTMNVTVDADGVVVRARELGSDCTCNSGEWPEPGECVSSNDGVSCTCDPAPASCIDRLRIERAGAVLAEGSYDAELGGAAHLTADLATDPSELVVIGCGGQARIALPAVVGLPQPTIDAVTDDGESLRIAWSSTPAAASALVSGGDGFVSTACHDTTGTVDLPSVRPGLAEEAFVSVHAFVGPAAVETGLGPARVWAGVLAEDTVLSPPE